MKPRKITCPKCKGTGEVHKKWTEQLGIFDSNKVKCSQCFGSGKITLISSK